jgi:hypothetical protein
MTAAELRWPEDLVRRTDESPRLHAPDTHDMIIG